MGRGIKHFYAEGAKIENANKVDREVEFEELALKADLATGNDPTAGTTAMGSLPEDDNRRKPDGQKEMF